MQRSLCLFITACLGLAAGCRKAPDASEIFHLWGCDNAAELRQRFDQYKNLLVVHVTESRLEDRGPHAETPFHFKGTVFKSYKGNWSAGEKLDFVHYLDSSVPTNVPLTKRIDELIFVMTDEHTNAEIVLDTGDFITFDSEYAPAVRAVFPE